MSDTLTQKELQGLALSLVDDKHEWNRYPQSEPSSKSYDNYIVIREKFNNFFETMNAGWQPNHNYTEGKWVRVRKRVTTDVENVILWKEFEDLGEMNNILRNMSSSDTVIW